VTVSRRGLDSFKRFAEAWYLGFPDRHFELIEEWIDGDRIATLFHITGTHLGEFLGQAATGNAIDVKVMNFLRTKAGKVTAIHAFFNPLELLQPLGLAPARNALGLRP
jgi:predicted ester cyclase